MKVATFNINNINRRLPNLLAWLKSSQPDVVCLQELKCTQSEFPELAINTSGYDCVWRGEKTWNGVAILSRIGTPILTRIKLPGGHGDEQSRYIEAAIKGIIFGCIYLPNGNPLPGPKFEYKLAWVQRLKSHAKSLHQQKVPAILAGDFNIAPTNLDIYPTSSWDNDALVHPKSRRAYAQLLKQGWIDSIRKLNPNKRVYTFWHYMRKRWERDAGLRLDHLLLSPSIARRLREGGVDRDTRGKINASDHAPTWITLT